MGICASTRLEQREREHEREKKQTQEQKEEQEEENRREQEQRQEQEGEKRREQEREQQVQELNLWKLEVERKKRQEREAHEAKFADVLGRIRDRGVPDFVRNACLPGREGDEINIGELLLAILSFSLLKRHIGRYELDHVMNFNGPLLSVRHDTSPHTFTVDIFPSPRVQSLRHALSQSASPPFDLSNMYERECEIDRWWKAETLHHLMKTVFDRFEENFTEHHGVSPHHESYRTSPFWMPVKVLRGIYVDTLRE